MPIPAATSAHLAITISAAVHPKTPVTMLVQQPSYAAMISEQAVSAASRLAIYGQAYTGSSKFVIEGDIPITLYVWSLAVVTTQSATTQYWLTRDGEIVSTTVSCVQLTVELESLPIDVLKMLLDVLTQLG